MGCSFISSLPSPACTPKYPVSRNNRLLETASQPLGTNTETGTAAGKTLRRPTPWAKQMSHWASFGEGQDPLHTVQSKWTTTIRWSSQRQTEPDKLLIYPQIPQRAKEIVGSRECSRVEPGRLLILLVYWRDRAGTGSQALLLDWAPDALLRSHRAAPVMVLR